MRELRAIAVFIIAIGAGLALWAIGSRIATDAIAMWVGLLFGLLAGMGMGWLLSGLGRSDYEHGYAVGYQTAQRDELEREGQRLVMRQSAAMQQAQCPPAATVVPQYTVARPFAALTTALDHIPALVGEVVDEADLDWDDPVVLAQSMRQFRITGEVDDD